LTAVAVAHGVPVGFFLDKEPRLAQILDDLSAGLVTVQAHVAGGGRIQGFAGVVNQEFRSEVPLAVQGVDDGETVALADLVIVGIMRAPE